jgi:transcriptional regulator with XRE-family HTH domain
LGLSVARRRRELGYSQHDLAARCGIHRAYIGGIEQGRRNPTWRVLATVAKGLDISLSELAARAEAAQAALDEERGASSATDGPGSIR